MSLRDFLEKQFIKVIQWTESDQDTLAWRYPMQDMEIQNGGKLTVRESQAAAFVNEGRIADVFGPGLYTLTTQTLPLLTDLMNWDKEFKSPFKSDVYFFSTRIKTDQRWGTATPITIRDKEFGAVRVRGYGIYSWHIDNPRVFHTKISGTREMYKVADLEGQLRNTIVGRMTGRVRRKRRAVPGHGRQSDRAGREDRRRVEAAVRRTGPGARQLRGRESLAARRVAEDARHAHRHEHDRRHGPVHAVSGGEFDADRGRQTRGGGIAGHRRRDWAPGSPWRKQMMNALNPQAGGGAPRRSPRAGSSGGACSLRRRLLTRRRRTSAVPAPRPSSASNAASPFPRRAKFCPECGRSSQPAIIEECPAASGSSKLTAAIRPSLADLTRMKRFFTRLIDGMTCTGRRDRVASVSRDRRHHRPEPAEGIAHRLPHVSRAPVAVLECLLLPAASRLGFRSGAGAGVRRASSVQVRRVERPLSDHDHMSQPAANCPSCGAPVQFRWSSAVQTVCPFCHSILVRADLDLKNVGKVADLPPDPSPISL